MPAKFRLSFRVKYGNHDNEHDHIYDVQCGFFPYDKRKKIITKNSYKFFDLKHRRTIGDGPRNFEPRSSDEEDT
ncbi:hypothetical protein NPIL_478121 [Nephila pilipes]|uniref:Uncharacterized protein n=1 Tax=Nephila pilipes TaxID=299642 RepID=A0A8X6U6A3_NEPPI|nr:hypothetical protein NPIL_478121 [Nephila pilipes]